MKMVQSSHLWVASLHKRKSIIAMKGAPFTRKTEFGSLIAASLSCPLLSVEDFLNVLSPDNVQISPNTPHTSSTPLSQLPQDLAFQITCQMAESHISGGVSSNVVIDSPLSSRSHLDQLIELSWTLKARLVVVECKPENTYLWQMKFEQHLQENPHLTCKWWKARSWDEVIKESIQHKDDDEISNRYEVSKLVLDPLLDYLHNPADGLTLFDIDQGFVPPPFMEAVKYLMTRMIFQRPNVVAYRQWQGNSCIPSANGGESSQTKEMEIQNQGYYFCRDTHTITKYSEELGLEYKEVECMACGNQIKDSGAYACNNCILALHKECAESFDKNTTWGNPLYKEWFGKPRYRFPQVFDCSFCKENGKAFSDECASCLFETVLKCRLRPTVINHGCDEHFLSISLSPINTYGDVHMCSACGSDVEFVFYTCKICGTYYHFNCLHEIPIQMKHEHGGHHHQLLLMFNDHEKAEDYLCDECLELRDPGRWFLLLQRLPILCSFGLHPFKD